MMYADSLERLFFIARKAGIRFTAHETLSDETKALISKVFGNDQASLIFEHGYPSGMRIPWSAEFLRIFPLTEIAEKQSGYRTNANTAVIDPRWDQTHWVIADKSSDPITISQCGSNIYHAVHGTGNWKMVPVTENISTFFELITMWIEFFIIQNKGNIFDDDYEITNSKQTEIEHLLRNIPGLADISETLAFITGE